MIALVLACDYTGNPIGMLMPYDMNRYCAALYMYVDQNCTVSGTYGNETFNCSFNAGWNFMYSTLSSDGSRFTYTTQKPQGVNLQWMYIDASEMQ